MAIKEKDNATLVARQWAEKERKAAESEKRQWKKDEQKYGPICKILILCLLILFCFAGERKSEMPEKKIGFPN